MDVCFVERISQKILSIAKFSVGLGSLNVIAKSFTLVV